MQSLGIQLQKKSTNIYQVKRHEIRVIPALPTIKEPYIQTPHNR